MRKVLYIILAILVITCCKDIEVLDYRFQAKLQIETSGEIYPKEEVTLRLDISQNDLQEDLQFSYSINSETLLGLHLNDKVLPQEGSVITNDRESSFLLKFTPHIAGNYQIIYKLSNSIYALQDTCLIKVLEKPIVKTFDVNVTSKGESYIYEPTMVEVQFSNTSTSQVGLTYYIDGERNERLYRNGMAQPDTMDLNISLLKRYSYTYTPSTEGKHAIFMEFFDDKGYKTDTTISITTDSYKESFQYTISAEDTVHIADTAFVNLEFHNIAEGIGSLYMGYDLIGPRTDLYLHNKSDKISKDRSELRVNETSKYQFFFIPPQKGTYYLYSRYWDEHGYISRDTITMTAEDYKHTFSMSVSSPKEGYISRAYPIRLTFSTTLTSIYLDYIINNNQEEKLRLSEREIDNKSQEIDLSLSKTVDLIFTPKVLGSNSIDLTFYDKAGYKITHKLMFNVREWGEVSISESDLSLTEGQTHQLDYSTSPASMGYNFTSSDNATATVTTTGVITAHKIGQCKVYLTLSNGMSDSVTVNIHAAPTQYDVMAVCNPVESGTITGIGKYTYGDTATLQVTANKGYHFRRWDDGNTDNPRTMVVNNAISRTAYLDRLVSNITITPATSTVFRGEQIQLTATVLPADASNKSVTWHSSDASVATVSSAGVVTTHKKGSVIITARSVDESQTEGACHIQVLPNKYTVTVSAGEGGYTTPSGTFEIEEDTELDLMAQAYEHYTFSRWSDGKSIAHRTVTINSDITYVAEFTPNRYEVIVDILPTATAGSIEGIGEYTYKTNAHLTAHDTNSDYIFSHYMVNGSPVYQRSIDITVLGTTHLQAHWKKAVKGVRIADFNNILTLDQEYDLQAAILPADAGNKSIQWSCSPDYGTFSSTSTHSTVFTPNKNVGEVTITCHSLENPDIRDSRTITIRANVNVYLQENENMTDGVLYVYCDKELPGHTITIDYTDERGRDLSVTTPISQSATKVFDYNTHNGYLISSITPDSELITLTINTK